MTKILKKESSRLQQRGQTTSGYSIPDDVHLFLQETCIENPQILSGSLPFELWPAQREAIEQLQQSQKVVFIKARQIGITWTICGYALWMALREPNRKIFILSKSLPDAQEVINRFEFMYDHHKQRAFLPKITTNNTTQLCFENGSVLKVIAATKKAGRSLTGTLVILDEFAFMADPKATYAAVQPTINDGGKLVIISTADGNGSYFHSMVKSVNNDGTKLVFIPWYARPERPKDFRKKLMDDPANDPNDVLKEYPETVEEAFTAASGLVYERSWSKENITSLGYDPAHGRVLLFIDDGYSAGAFPATKGIDPATKTYCSTAHPRVFLAVQERNDGQLVVFQEFYACLKFSDEHIKEVLEALPTLPDFVVYDKSAAELKGRLQAYQLYTQSSVSQRDESIKNLRRMIAPDMNGWRHILVNQSCFHLIHEMNTYRYAFGSDTPQKFFDHGPDALRYGAWYFRQKEGAE